jgi:hypothetical protein
MCKEKAIYGPVDYADNPKQSMCFCAIHPSLGAIFLEAAVVIIQKFKQ